MEPTRNARRRRGKKGNSKLLGIFCPRPRLMKLVSCAENGGNLTLVLPITTRGIGFIVSRFTSDLGRSLTRRGSLERMEVPIAAIYRLSLAQLEVKMYSETGKPRFKTSSMLHYGQLFDQRFGYFNWSPLKWYPINLSPIAHVINSIGSVTLKNKTFRPVFYKEESPLNIRLHNLRAYCDKMANPETPSSKRVEGFELNSIPNAKWALMDENNPESVRLTNPDEIMPSDYLENLSKRIHEDISILQEFIHNAHLNVPVANIEFECEGDPSILVSTHVVRGKSLALNHDVISGNAIEFWSLDYIPEDSWKLGVLALTGEVLNQDDCTARSNVEGVLRCFLNWRGIADCVL